MSQSDVVRIALIHALEESVLPARRAFAEVWPEAFCFDLLDTSLAIDLAAAGRLDESMTTRFETLARYSLAHQGKAGATQAILFTCSAFGPAIDALKALLPVPVLRPNEAAFEQALEHGSRIGLVVTYEPSLASLRDELQAMARQRGRAVEVVPILAKGALAALKAGDGEGHDQLVVSACAAFADLDVVVLGQFSLARAAAAVQGVFAVPVLTTPGCAVEALRRRLEFNSASHASLSSHRIMP
ncbi:aspartate/glutamate racemase family protein [Pseudomonas sp. CNPSo 3701]|uniref:aspartate/glutamate racemase family protein n=1 Tax=Pseudomonas sp. CNPSo 3701 TaxID=3027943 RepID=UPI0023637BEA|nr:aspartate/glutamate racemase family protein [Pseudomonas sp. CNPSo 3701]MDD1506812.1 aspartate/glutamate racemase family protein [Pseudomonas sp. CNPSo 3701]